MKSLLIVLVVLLLSVTASATAEIVSKDITWSEYPILSYIGIGDYIETVTYSDGYQENIYHRGFGLMMASITGMPESITYIIGQPELTIPIQLKGMSCSLSNTPYSYHHLGLYDARSANNFLLHGKTVGGIICDKTVSYDFIIPKSDLGAAATNPGTYLFEVKETSWNTLELNGRILYENRKFELVVYPTTSFADFKAETLVPSKFVITTSETISISSRIKNIGTQTATLSVELKVNNVYYSSQSVTLNSGESKTITFDNVRFPIAGNHKISILEQSNTIVVSGITLPTPTPTPTIEGKISVTSDPSGATVRISTEEIGKTPVSVYRPAGNYILATSMSGYKTDYYGVTVTSGNTVSHYIKLTPIPVTTPAPTPTPTPTPTLTPSPTPSPTSTPIITPGTTPSTTPGTTPDIDIEVECYSGYVWDDTYKTCRPITETVIPSGDTTTYLIIGAVLITGIFLLTRKK